MSNQLPHLNLIVLHFILQSFHFGNLSIQLVLRLVCISVFIVVRNVLYSETGSELKFQILLPSVMEVKWVKRSDLFCKISFATQIEA